MTELSPQTPAQTSRRKTRRRLSRGAALVGALGIIFFFIGMTGSSYQAKLTDVQQNDNAAFLPASSESTKLDKEAQEFQSVQAVPGFVIYQRDGGLTAADRAAITAQTNDFRAIDGVAADQVGDPEFADDGATASTAVPLVGNEDGVSVEGDQLAEVQKAVVETARAGVPDGVEVHSAGPAGLLAALIDSFSGLDVTLLLAAVLVVILILLIVYRSPVLWIFPLLGAVAALGAASMIVYMLADRGSLTLNGQSSGILSVLVLGAGTDYALLLISRYREELHNYESRVEAMTKAWRSAAMAILASGATVILGLLTLSFGELNSNKSLGPVAAIGVACTVVVMLTFLPTILAVMPRRIFWPRIPQVDHAGNLATTGLWARTARWIGRHNRRAWVGAAIALGICAIGLTTLNASGLPASQGFTKDVDAVVGQKIYDANFQQGSGAPAQITTTEATVADVISAVSKVPGVSTEPGAVCVAPDYGKLADAAANEPAMDPGAPGCPPSELTVAPQDGRQLINANLTHNYDSPQAFETVKQIREAVAGVPHADALVGGEAAVNYDTNEAARHDRNLIIPIVLVVIMLILMLLLRAVIAPVLLIASVVLSFGAALGISAVFFKHVFGYANADPAYPLFVFVFLVALGVDYNIFLMTRVREETLVHGTREGILRGLAVTGGVITSAGIVLAATFAVLQVIPLVALSEMGFTVAIGVLLDTFVVRSILVPALAYDIGKKIWWPSRLATTSDGKGR